MNDFFKIKEIIMPDWYNIGFADFESGMMVSRPPLLDFSGKNTFWCISYIPNDTDKIMYQILNTSVRIVQFVESPYCTYVNFMYSSEVFIDYLKKAHPDGLVWFLFHPEILEGRYE